MSSPQVYRTENFYPTLGQNGGPVPTQTALSNPLHPYETGCSSGLGFKVRVSQLSGNTIFIESCFCKASKVKDVANLIIENGQFYSPDSKKRLLSAKNGLDLNPDQELRSLVSPGQEILFLLVEKFPA